MMNKIMCGYCKRCGNEIYDEMYYCAKREYAFHKGHKVASLLVAGFCCKNCAQEGDYDYVHEMDMKSIIG